MRCWRVCGGTHALGGKLHQGCAGATVPSKQQSLGTHTKRKNIHKYGRSHYLENSNGICTDNQSSFCGAVVEIIVVVSRRVGT